MRLVGHGHPAIRGTHRKTLEFSADADITERATCVVAVGATGSQPAAGDVRLTLSVDSESYSFEARANSSWQPEGNAVIRCSPLRLPGTFATHASAAAADIPRALIEAARNPAALVELAVEPMRGRPCAVLFALDASRPSDPRLAAERGAADLVVAEDADAAEALGVQVVRDVVAVTGRVLVVAGRDLPGHTVAPQLADVDIETVGLPPLLAAAAASPSRAPLLLTGADTDARTILRDAPAAARVAVAVPGEQVAAILRLAADLRGGARAVLVHAHAPPVRVDADHPPRETKGIAYLCFDAVPGADALDPRVRAAIDALVADGVATKSAAAALAALSGWDRRRAYAAVLSWRRQS